MNDATRKRLEAAGWVARSTPDNEGVIWHWHGGWAYSELMELLCYTRTNKPSLTALRAFIEAFEQEGGDDNQ